MIQSGSGDVGSTGHQIGEFILTSDRGPLTVPRAYFPPHLTQTEHKHLFVSVSNFHIVESQKPRRERQPRPHRLRQRQLTDWRLKRNVRPIRRSLLLTIPKACSTERTAPPYRTTSWTLKCYSRRLMTTPITWSTTSQGELNRDLSYIFFCFFCIYPLSRHST